MKPPFLKALDFMEKDLRQKENTLLEFRVHVTKECNLKCIYCLSNAPFIKDKQDNKTKNELTLCEIKEVIIEAKKLGAKTITITGSGEPLLYNCLKELVEYIKNLGLQVVIFTNGLLLTKELAEFFYKNDVNLMIKFNSFNPEVNDKLVGVEGAQKIFLEKIQMLVNMGFAKERRLALNSIICEENYNEISKLFIFCREHGIIPWIETITIAGRAKPDMVIPQKKIEKLYKKIAEIDKKQFGFKWKPDSSIVGADKRRYNYICQVDLYGNVYPTDAHITDEVGNIRNKNLYELISSDKFKKLRKKDKHTRKVLDSGVQELSEKIYKILTNKRFRAGSLPPEKSKRLIIQKIIDKISKELPVELFQFWGGCKNPNLPIDFTDLCEEATLDNLNKLNSEVKRIYQPGLKIYISPGDSRVERVNLIPNEKTKKYVESLNQVAGQNKYNHLFTVIPLSTLYKKHSKEFENKLKEVKKRISKEIESRPDFEKLIVNARKNVFGRNLETEEKIRAQSIKSARDYVFYRVAEEEAGIFREFKDCIRSFFIKYIPFYKQYIKDINQTIPHLNRFLVFFTGRKGNITQPWQAISKKKGEEILFLSQERLKRLEEARI